MDKRLLRKYSVTEKNYGEFKKYVHDVLKSVTFATYEECYNHVKTIDKIEDSIIIAQLHSWHEKLTIDIEKIERFESEINKAITSHLIGYKKYNPLTNVSIISKGDVLDQPNDKDIYLGGYCINDPRTIDDINGTELIVSNVLHFISELIKVETESIKISSAPSDFKNSVRVIYDDVFLKKEEKGISINIKLLVAKTI